MQVIDSFLFFLFLYDNFDTAVGVWEKWCRHLGGGDPQTCIFDALVVNEPSVRCFEQVDYEKALRQHFITMFEGAM